MKQFTFKKKLIAGTAVTALALGVGGTAAFAYWTAGGTGSGTVTTATVSPITVNQNAATAGLSPGGSVALSGTFTNTANAGGVFITSVTATIGAFDKGDPTAKFPPHCTQADFSITGTATVGAVVPNGTSVGSWSGLSLHMNDSGANQNNCQNVVVPIVYAAN
jgi:hypothetical protein